MVKTLDLNIAITKNQTTKRNLAKKLGISEQSFYNKANNVVEFKASEVAKLKKELKLTDKECLRIFFNQ